MTDAEFLLSLKAKPLSINGHVDQPNRRYLEVTEDMERRFQTAAGGLELLDELAAAYCDVKHADGVCCCSMESFTPCDSCLKRRSVREELTRLLEKL